MTDLKNFSLCMNITKIEKKWEKNEKIKKKDARRERDVGRIDWTFLQATVILLIIDDIIDFFFDVLFATRIHLFSVW